MEKKVKGKTIPSVESIYRELKTLGFSKKNLIQRPILNENHNKRRLKWVLKYESKRWANWITMDEKWFESGKREV